jgi:hypothetical protein
MTEYYLWEVPCGPTYPPTFQPMIYYRTKIIPAIVGFDHQTASMLHQRNVDFIREQLMMGYCIVITHHAPSYTCIFR